jgi:hypothetical protein
MAIDRRKSRCGGEYWPDRPVLEMSGVGRITERGVTFARL